MVSGRSRIRNLGPIPRLLVAELLKVRGKGRLTNPHDIADRRNRSWFEIAEAGVRERQRRLQGAGIAEEEALDFS